MADPIYDGGEGPAIVLIPGIQGRWEWMRPAIAALAARWRVITGSLPAESDGGFDSYVAYVDHLLDSAHISTAVICGVSFGGLIALRYAARRPERVRALILVSTPGPQWKPSAQQARYMRRPILSSPLFALAAVKRVWSELCVTLPDLRGRLVFCATSAFHVVAAPGIPSRMGSRACLAAAEDFEGDCAEITAPTLVIAGERGLDKVVGFENALAYLSLIRGAQFQLFENTGHLGTISAPERFAAIVSKFLNGLAGGQ